MVGGSSERELIGRTSEMEVAAQLLREVAAGNPRLLVLTGPAGVGKSTLARAIAADAARDGGRVLWGAGHEDLSIPYLPMAMAFEGLRDDEHPAPLVLDDDPTRSWAIAGARLIGAAARQVVVLVVDDLQWTDAASQSLFLHLLVMVEHSSQSQPVRCLTIVTLRTPVEDERTGRTLARIEREPGVQLLDVQGLDRVAVADLMATFCPSRPSAALVARVTEATAGNPLLVQSLVRRGLNEHRLVEHNGALGLRDAGEHLSIDPSELDKGVMARLAALRPETHRMLTVAALLGDEQALDELLDVAGLDAVTADPLLDEAVAAGLLIERGSRCSFAHPQVRHVLFHGPTQRARQRLHLDLADALERRHGVAGALVVAHHLARAGSLPDGQRVARWCRLAADQARLRGAWADASIAGEQALEAIGDDAPWDERVDLHLLVTDMASFDFDLATAERHGAAAIALAKEHGDSERWGHAVLRLSRTVFTNSSERAVSTDPSALLHDFLEANAEGPSALRAEVLGLLSEILSASGRSDEALDTVTAATELLDADTDPAIAGLVYVAEGLVRWARLELAEATHAYDRTIEVAGLDPGARSGTYAAVRVNLVRHLAGDVERALQSATAAADQLEAAQVWGEHALAAAVAASAAVALGRYDEAERFGELSERSVRRSAYLEARGIALPAIAQGRAVRGDGRGASEALDLVTGRSGSGARYRVAVDSMLGDADRVRSALIQRRWRPPGLEASLASLPRAVLHAEVASAIDDGDMAREAVSCLQDAHRRGVVVSYGWSALLSRAIGECEAAIGRFDVASDWLNIAAEEARSLGLVLEMGRVELARARLLAASGSPDDETIVQAGRAALVLDEIGALPLVAAARRLGALSGDGEGPARRVIVFTDLVDSTRLNVKVGDRAFLDLVREHNDVVRGCLRRSSGVEFKHTGDGVAAWFTSPADAIECTMAINAELDRVSLLHPDLPLLVRCGVAAGEPLGNEGDLFGLSVVRAARLCAAADAGEVLVGPEVVPMARAHGVVFQPRGPMVLKGFPDPVDVYVAVMTDSRTGPR